MEYFIGIIIGLVVGILATLLIKFFIDKKTLNNAQINASTLLETAKSSAESYKKELLADTKKEISELKKESEADIKERRQIILDLENKASQRETNLNNRSTNLDKREDSLNSKQSELDRKLNELGTEKKELDALKESEKNILNDIAKLSIEDARNIIMDDTREKMKDQILVLSREIEEDAVRKAEKTARNLLAISIQKYANDVVSEIAITNVSLPNDEIKGKLIGRDGRNIRSFEAATGTELKIDDTPETVTICGFDPVRREVARKALEALILDGRIHPAQIENFVNKFQKETDNYIRQKGENAIDELKIGRVHPDLIKLVGRLHYRTSYGQNNLLHSIEVANIAGKLAVELGENEILARRAGLLHDIGKSVDHDVTGTHVEIGVNLATRFKEPFEVIDAIASHHGDKEASSVIAVLVAAADAVSASRPGARNEDMENYLQRISKLEQIPNSIKGVEKAYALQAGREIRVIVVPDMVDDNAIYGLAKEIREKIEESLSYPGTIKVTVIREKRATETAK